ncbi:hypothetical protein EBZ38_08505 [bacterium]|nr:hypothetical protein [bacterium]
MSSILQSKTAIVCPSGKNTNQPLIIDLTLIHEVEQRIQEVAFVTSQKAPELMARFNEAFLVLTEYLPKVDYQKLVAQREADKRKSVVLLDEATKILKEKGLSSSADLRKAVLDSDEQYQELCDRVHQISCIYEQLDGKKKAIEMAYTATKKVLGENIHTTTNRLNSLVEQSAGAGQVIDSSGNVVAGFGKPKY